MKASMSVYAQERLLFLESRAIPYLQGKKLLSSVWNGQCFIKDLLLQIGSMPVARGDGALGMSLEPDVNYGAQDTSLLLMKVREQGG